MQRKTTFIALLGATLVVTGMPAFGATAFTDFINLWGKARTSTTTAAQTTTTAAATTTTTASTPTTTLAAGADLPAAQTCGLPNFQQELLTRINQLRAAGRVCGALTYAAAPPLAWNAKLFHAAAAHSADMAANNYFSHTSSDGRSFSQRITDAGYSWSAAAENIAAGQTSVEQVMNAWANSAGHCANMMNRNYTEVGLACVRNDSAAYRTYWTMELARPK